MEGAVFEKPADWVEVENRNAHAQGRHLPIKPNIDFKAFSSFGNKEKLVITKSKLRIGI